jgi:putative RecB family exonuclease
LAVVSLALAPPRRRSYSQLSTYAECGNQYKLKYVLKAPRKQAVWFPAGTAFHSTCDDIDRALMAGEPLDAEEIDGRWEVNFSGQLEEVLSKEPDPKKWRTAGRKTKEKPNGEDTDWWAKEGARMARQYAEFRVRNADRLRLWELPDGSPAIEVAITVEIGGAPVVQFVDRVFEAVQTGALQVVDLKTGSREPAGTLQLGTYKVGLEAAFNEPVWWGAYYMARDGDLTEPKDLSRWTPELLDRTYRDMDTAERLGIYLPSIGSHCNGCEVRDFCVFQGGIEPTERGIAA